MRPRVWLLLGPLLAAVACSASQMHYRATLRDWTRKAEVFDFHSMRAELMWNVVWITPEVREARVLREAELRNVSPSEAAEHLPSDWYGPGTRFYVGFFAPRDMKDLEAADGYWRFQLKDANGGSYRATAIARQEITPLDRKLFPFLTYWTKAYIVSFPEIHGPPAHLTLYGLNAKSTLRW